MRISTIFGLLVLCSSQLFAASGNYDLVVYGGTAGGVVTSVAAARHGLKVLLLEPGKHLGGMATGGLSRTDFGKKEVIGGHALEFYWRVGQKYDIGRFAQSVAWYYEPHVGEQVFQEMLSQAKVEVMLGHRLKEKGGVAKSGTTLNSLTTEDGSTFQAAIFADCSYEGDLMAQAGVQYTWGREASAKYGESLGGVRDRTPKHQFLSDISAKDEQGRLLPEVMQMPTEKPGDEDKKVQAYNFRMILSDDPANQVSFPKPPGYDPRRYELFARVLEARTKQLGRSPVLHEVTLIAPIPGHKADFNNQGAFSTDYIGGSWEYPNGSYEKRAQIWQQHIDYTKGYFYFLAHDSRVPKELQQETNRWGLAKDEYQDTEHWPHQLYIREGRRMVSDFVMSQKDIQTELTKQDAIGMGSYNSDSHNIQRFINAKGFAENEGDMQVGVSPYQIPYRVMLPKKEDAANLLVPVCFSASHVAYSTLRMEPQYMIIGQAAGDAAALALQSKKSVHEIDRQKLGDTLREEGAVMTYQPSALPANFFNRLWQNYKPQSLKNSQSPW